MFDWMVVIFGGMCIELGLIDVVFELLDDD